ncbi:hypothetical protein [Pseudomonas sp. SCB32]|uniref:hypothetical protein n=1 Tax=Pseudomonas sp. SCB32 TaxID=2653853 RepID=UPI0015B5D6EA|nr:hypothetical protein [Pseudomonas sp. SCB32]
MNRTLLCIAACLSATSLLALAETPQTFLQSRVYELRRDTSPPSCYEWVSGLPNGVWGNGADYAQKTEKLMASGSILVASATYKATGELISHSFYKSRGTCQKDLSRRPEAIPRNVATAVPVKAEAPGQSSSYIDRLERDFGQRLYFSSPQAESIVRKFNIDCKAPDRRYLPLYNALLARLHEGSTPDAWMETSVVNTGKNIQVFDSVRLKSGKELTPQLILEINEWGAIETHGIRPDALSNACFGSYGPIWKI